MQTKRALLSVANKEGLVDLAKALIRHGYALVSTGGTMKALNAAELPVESLAELTKLPEMLGGRVKTLHPAVFAGILARDSEADRQTLAEYHYAAFDLVVVNLYPFVAAAKRPNLSDEELIEEIDIGGVSLLRAAAKNHARVGVVSDPSDYPEIIAALEAQPHTQEGQLPTALRRELAVRTLFRTATYDAQIAQTLAERDGLSLGQFRQVAFGYDLAYGLRYGENPHQVAAAFIDPGASHSLLEAAKLQGKALSYNNLLDVDAAIRLLNDLPGPSAVIVKHNTPCGAASAATIEEAYALALAGDPKSAFGGIVALSAPIDEALAQKLCEIFLEVVVAPSFSRAAKTLLQSKKNVRVLELKELALLKPARFEARPILGGVVVQTPDRAVAYTPKLVTNKAPTPAEERAMRFAWSVVRAVRSNAIVVAQADSSQARTVSLAGGQTSRVDAVEIALRKAGEAARGAVMASDAFFPFPDSIEVAHAAGIAAVIQPGGSVKDSEAIAAANAAGMAMWFSAVRHFRH